jgi:hypothetical protein
VRGRKLRILRTALETGRKPRSGAAALYVENGVCYADCGGGGVLRVIEIDLDGTPLAAAALDRALAINGALLLRAD